MAGCFLVYLYLNNIICLKCFTTKNVRLKEAESRFLVYLSLINIVCLKCSTTKNGYSKQVGGCFLVYSSLISIVRLMLVYVQSKWKAAFQFFLSIISIVHLMFHSNGKLLFIFLSLICIVRLKCFYYEFYKTTAKGCSLNCCFLVYLANYIKLLRAPAF